MISIRNLTHNHPKTQDLSKVTNCNTFWGEMKNAILFQILQILIIPHNLALFECPSLLYWFHHQTLNIKNIVTAFRGMHVSPAKHSYAWLPRKRDYGTDARTHRQTDGRIDRRRTKWSLCAAMLRRRHKNWLGQNQASQVHCLAISEFQIGWRNFWRWHLLCSSIMFNY